MNLVISKCVTAVKVSNFSGHYLRNRSTLDKVFWVISVYFNIRNTLPKFCPFLLGHPVYGKCKAVPLQSWTGHEGSGRLRLPWFQDNRHMKVVSCQPYAAANFTSQGEKPGTHFFYRLSQPQGHSEAGRDIYEGWLISKVSNCIK